MPFLLLMPSYNQARYIREAIESCLTQDDPDWELWILDNSSDETPGVVASFRDPRIHFEHRPERMSPGACLDRLLQEARGEHFSYIHTDNNLAPGFVREMRRALGTDPLALAYCDLRLIDGEGRPVGVCRRPEFGEADILGTASLGVPFAATTELARRLGGFSHGGLADDTLFCVRAFGLGPWKRVARPLVDYRLHATSRTEHAGALGVRRAVLEGHALALPELEARGLRPLEAMARRIRKHLDELESALEDAWLKTSGPEWPADWESVAEGLFRGGWLSLSGFGPKDGGPPRVSLLREAFSGASRRAFRGVRREFMRRHDAFESVLAGWAWLTVGDLERPSLRFQVMSMDLGTLWAARILNSALGWEPVIKPGSGAVPGWLHWPTGECDGIWIDFRRDPVAREGGKGLVLESDRLP